MGEAEAGRPSDRKLDDTAFAPCILLVQLSRPEDNQPVRSGFLLTGIRYMYHLR